MNILLTLMAFISLVLCMHVDIIYVIVQRAF